MTNCSSAGTSKFGICLKPLPIEAVSVRDYSGRVAVYLLFVGARSENELVEIGMDTGARFDNYVGWAD